MTIPDVQDVARAAWHYLNENLSSLALGPPPHPDNALPPTFEKWVWREELGHTIENSQYCGVVLSEQGGWSAPNPHNTMRFPRLRVQIYADPDRLPDNTVRIANASDKARAVFAAADVLLHTTSLRGTSELGMMMWGDQRVLGSTRLGEPNYTKVSDGNGMVVCEVYYGVTMG